MSAERVDGVIASVGRHDPRLARWMQMAADGLTAGEGTGRLSQAGLQQYLWYDLPRRAPVATWRPVAEAAGVLLALLGLDRYAAIARSATTESVLDAWAVAPGKGFTEFTAANAASGVEPPDTGLLAWGEVFGMEELWARSAVETALEAAIVEGGLRPGGRSWRATAAEISDSVLTGPVTDGGPTRLAAVLGERAGLLTDRPLPRPDGREHDEGRVLEASLRQGCRRVAQERPHGLGQGARPGGRARADEIRKRGHRHPPRRGWARECGPRSRRRRRR